MDKKNQKIIPTAFDESGQETAGIVLIPYRAYKKNRLRLKIWFQSEESQYVSLDRKTLKRFIKTLQTIYDDTEKKTLCCDHCGKVMPTVRWKAFSSWQEGKADDDPEHILHGWLRGASFLMCPEHQELLGTYENRDE